MNTIRISAAAIVLGLSGFAAWVDAQQPAGQSSGRDFSQLPANTWIKLSPLDGTPPSPRLGYEGACVWDSRHQVLIRYGGHNQGGGGEQGSEIWTFDPRTARWQFKEPNTSPPGICCGQQNVFDQVQGRYVRFPAFSASHGWQWWREVYLNDASVWTYDLAANRWRNMRPLPTAHPRPLRCASWDAEHQVIVLFGGEGSSEGTWVYDPWDNSWTRMRPPSEPPGRSGGNMAYDARRKLHVLFGAQFDDDPHTWAYDLRSNTWRDLGPPAEPPTDKNDAVLTYDASAGRIVAIIKVTTGKDDEARHRLETWTFDVTANRWTALTPAREPDPTGNRARQLLFAPQLGVALLENRSHPPQGPAEQQIWALRLPADSSPDEGPPAPRDLIAKADRKTIALAWMPVAGAAAYTIYRGHGERPWQVEYRQIAKAEGAAKFEDREPPAEGVPYYFVRAVDRAGREGSPSLTVRVQPSAIDDVAVSVSGSREVQVQWQPPRGDVAGYHVERAVIEVLSDDQLNLLKAQTPPLETPSVGAIRRIGSFVRLTQAPLAEPRFTDTNIDLTRPAVIEGQPLDERRFGDDQLDGAGRAYRQAVYAYRVRAVDARGTVGGASPAVLTIPSSPQFVFAKEDAATCRLKWQANPEAGIRGYRVYRMDGRYSKDPISRLTEQPIGETAFADSGAGKDTRRYYVVAVDALGQEGFPSSPVWFNREWRPFYAPFVGEWHQ